jgi:hypothetical protein
MCPIARRVSDILFLTTIETPWRALPYSRSWVSKSHVSIKNMVTLLAWECGSHLHGPQKLKVHLHTIGLEYETTKMARVDQRLWARSALSSKKADVVADALGCKAHCFYLLVVPLTGEESNIKVLLDLLLYNIILTPLLWGRDHWCLEEWWMYGHLRSRLSEGDPKINCLHEDAEGILWFKDKLGCQRKKRLRRRYWTKPIRRGILFI